MVARSDAGLDTGSTALIIHADDFGLTAGVTRGILEAHAAGVVTSTSVMVGTPGWLDAASRLRLGSEAQGAPDVGLHLNLLVGHPLTDAASLVDRRSGAFLPLATLVSRALTGRIDASDVATECAAQIQALRSESGAVVTHLDSHRHTHLLPSIWAAVVAVADREAIPFVRVPAEPWRTARTRRVRAQLHRVAVSASGWRPNLRPRSGFTGLTLDGGDDFLAGVLRTIAGLPPGVTELMVHPGYTDSSLTALDGYTWQRERELAALLDPSVAERLGRGDIRLTTFAYI